MTLEPASAQVEITKPSRKGLYLPIAGLALLIAIWSGVWYFAAGTAQKVAGGFIQREAERGREWVCPNQNISGYPFRIEITCDKPQLFERGPEGLHREASLGGLSLHGRILSPGHYIAVLSPPFIIRQGTLGEMELAWKSARASFRGGQQAFVDASVEIVTPMAAIGVGENKDIRALAKNIEFHLRAAPGETPGTDLVLKIADLTFAPLDQLTGSPDPLKLEIQASAPGLVTSPGKRFADTLDAWRDNGGKARVIVANATKGKAALELSGTLGLDSLRRPEGSLQGRAKGLEALTGRFTRSTGFDIGGLLGKISGGQGLPVSLSLQNGQMRYGPFPITEVPPLY